MSDRTPEEIERDRQIANDTFGKTENTPTQSSFTDGFKPPEDYIPEPQLALAENSDDAVSTAQQRIITNLSNEMADTTLANIKVLAPKDEFEIPEGSGIIYKRQKVRPKDLRKLRKAQDEFLKATKDSEMSNEDRMDKEFQLIQIKAEVYLGMTEEQFEDTDYEYLQQVLQATELRTQGFRQRK